MAELSSIAKSEILISDEHTLIEETRASLEYGIYLESLLQSFPRNELVIRNAIAINTKATASFFLNLVSVVPKASKLAESFQTCMLSKDQRWFVLRSIPELCSGAQPVLPLSWLFA